MSDQCLTSVSILGRVNSVSAVFPVQARVGHISIYWTAHLAQNDGPATCVLFSCLGDLAVRKCIEVGSIMDVVSSVEKTVRVGSSVYACQLVSAPSSVSVTRCDQFEVPCLSLLVTEIPESRFLPVVCCDTQNGRVVFLYHQNWSQYEESLVGVGCRISIQGPVHRYALSDRAEVVTLCTLSHVRLVQESSDGSRGPSQRPWHEVSRAQESDTGCLPGSVNCPFTISPLGMKSLFECCCQVSGLGVSEVRRRVTPVLVDYFARRPRVSCWFTASQLSDSYSDEFFGFSIEGQVVSMEAVQHQSLMKVLGRADLSVLRALHPEFESGMSVACIGKVWVLSVSDICGHEVKVCIPGQELKGSPPLLCTVRNVHLGDIVDLRGLCRVRNGALSGMGRAPFFDFVCHAVHGMVFKIGAPSIYPNRVGSSSSASSGSRMRGFFGVVRQVSRDFAGEWSSSSHWVTIETGSILVKKIYDSECTRLTLKGFRVWSSLYETLKSCASRPVAAPIEVYISQALGEEGRRAPSTVLPAHLAVSSSV